MYNNPYYNPQASIDRINNQIAELERLKTQIPQQAMQPTNLTQNFQLAPTSKDTMKYANSIDEVQKNVIMNDTPYFSKDMSVVWIKNTNGDIKTYELNEIIAKDDKDIKIEMLMTQIAELKEVIKNEHFTNVDEPIKDEKSTSVSTISKSSKKSK